MVAALVLMADGLIATQAPLSLLVSLPLTGAVLALAAARRHGMSALAYYWAKLAWRRASRFEATAYRRMLLPHPYALDLPGVGASSTLIKAHDPTTGSTVGVVHDRIDGVHDDQHAAGPRRQPDGPHRGGAEQPAHLVVRAGRDEHGRPGEGRVSVTIQITPGAGEALGDDVKARQGPVRAEAGQGGPSTNWSAPRRTPPPA